MHYSVTWSYYCILALQNYAYWELSEALFLKLNHLWVIYYIIYYIFIIFVILLFICYLFTKSILKVMTLQCKDIFVFFLCKELLCTGWLYTGWLCTGWLAVRQVWNLSYCLTPRSVHPVPPHPVCPAQCCRCRCLLGGALKFTHLLNILLSGQCPRTRIHMYVCVHLYVCVCVWYICLSVVFGSREMLGKQKQN